ncbi:hypothetical protein [Kangiella sp. TOML190]|uniref:hypothetical protein n=1 Tax=Kangiella sp. TOML190 TaxID=2931351 RepID=UPI0020408C56|nr:hypothetical protein [Kangiella sp. TOML190]
MNQTTSTALITPLRKCAFRDVLFVLILFAVAALLTQANAEEIQQIGTYKVVLKGQSQHLNCRSGPGKKFPITRKLDNGTEVMAVRTLPHGSTWFLTNFACFVKADSQFLEIINLATEDVSEVKDPRIFR